MKMFSSQGKGLFKPTPALLLSFRTPVCWLVSNSLTELGGGSLNGGNASIIVACGHVCVAFS